MFCYVKVCLPQLLGHRSGLKGKIALYEMYAAEVQSTIKWKSKIEVHQSVQRYLIRKKKPWQLPSPSPLQMSLRRKSEVNNVTPWIVQFNWRSRRQLRCVHCTQLVCKKCRVNCGDEFEVPVFEVCALKSWPVSWYVICDEGDLKRNNKKQVEPASLLPSLFLLFPHIKRNKQLTKYPIITHHSPMSDPVGEWRC